MTYPVASTWFPSPFTEEQSALEVGVTGFTFTPEELTDPDTKITYPSVQPVLGWGLLMDPNSRFQN